MLVVSECTKYQGNSESRELSQNVRQEKFHRDQTERMRREFAR